MKESEAGWGYSMHCKMVKRQKHENYVRKRNECVIFYSCVLKLLKFPRFVLYVLLQRLVWYKIRGNEPAAPNAKLSGVV